MATDRIKYIFIHYLSYTLVQTLLRIILFVLSYAVMSHEFPDVVLTFAFGVLYDMAVGTVYCLPLVLVLFLSPTRFLNGRRGKRLINVVAFLMNFFVHRPETRWDVPAAADEFVVVSEWV